MATIFQPIRGKESNIAEIQKSNGQLLIATDTGKMYMDISDTERVPIGGGNGNVIYEAIFDSISQSDDGYYHINIDELKDQSKQQVAGDLIISTDNIFYKVLRVDDDELICTMVSTNNGASIWYTEKENIELEDDEYYHFVVNDMIVKNAPCKLNDLIIDKSKGTIYRIDDINEDGILFCAILALSGGGGGSGEGILAKKIKVSIKNVAGSSNLINGQDAIAEIRVTSAEDSEGEILDKEKSIWVELEIQQIIPDGNGKNTYETYYRTTINDLSHNEVVSFNFGKYARHSAKSRIMVTAEGNASGRSTTQYMPPFEMSSMSLSLSETFDNGQIFDSTSVPIGYNAIGNMERVVDFYLDNMEVPIYSEFLKENDTGRNLYCLLEKYAADGALSHGNHTVKLALFQWINNARGVGINPIQFEIGVKTISKEPIVWLDNYDAEYYNYSDIKIGYHVYDPEPIESTITVNLLKNGIVNNTHIFSNVTSILQSSAFEIVDIDENKQNFYTIACKNVTRDISFKIIDDPDRNMHLQQQPYLAIKFDAKGRTNNDSTTKRQTWEAEYNNKIVKGSFEDFNWYNNGWISTENGTALRISNGASFSIPIGPLTFGGTSQLNSSHTFEFEFKIRNVQSYSNIISNITRYENDDEYYKEFFGYVDFKEDLTNNYNQNAAYFKQNSDLTYEKLIITNENQYLSEKVTNGVLYIGTEGYKTNYTNYDAFLQWYASTHDLDYDKITEKYAYTDKKFNLNALACSYYSLSNNKPIGFGLGPQDAFFSNETNTVNANYVEDQIINLAVVYSSSDKLMSIYVNGVLTGVIYSTRTDAFTVDAPAIVFNSKQCDIDLYKFRMYNTDLSINEIVTNYAVDKRDVVMYDQNTLVNINNKKLFDFEEMIKYNESEAYADNPVMPYIIFDTTNTNYGGKLSWSKKTELSIGVEFVNTPLEVAYRKGELQALADADGVSVEEYYLHHCPSWTGENISMKVQGTSSEYYPRRNYKLKTKDDNGVNMTAHKGPFANQNKQLDWFYMDNYTAGTTKFTMKIDFMESSGSYNRGLANLLKNAYSHHPLYYYAQSGAITKRIDNAVEAKTFVEGTKYSYYNHNNNLKVADGSEDNIIELTEELFELGPMSVYEKLMEDNPEVYTKLKVVSEAKDKNHYNKWYTVETTYEVDKNIDTDELRTCVQGFPVLAFNKYGDKYTYIGRYNMLLDKGSDEVYGFKYSDRYLKYFGNKDIKKYAECWEFENNSRGFCSFRDPLKRKFLSFNIDPEENRQAGIEMGVNRTASGYLDTTTSQAPSVVEDFEYRYHTNKDSIDTISGEDSTRIDNLTQTQKDTIKADTKVTVSTAEDGQNLLYDLYGNWEKAVQWVWSTCLDNAKHDDEILELPEEERIKYLISNYFKVNADEIYNSSKQYYQYKRHLYVPYSYNAETWDEDLKAGLYELRNYNVQFDEKGKNYIYDSYEYRRDKFKYELEKHFNLDYLATYFVVTEVLELYDSRGKNCMMGSWGPMEENGDFIWFPMFYDMDTQLGINNTGIPSFTFSIDATEEGCFSTNDSVLWNNFYLIFFNQILHKYNQLRGYTSGIGDFEKLSYAPFSNETVIEAWYESNPKECGSITMGGQRPLSAINLDEYYKYIAITNKSDGGYLGQSGEIIYDNTSTSSGNGSPKGSFFYALQGDRSLSRLQFLRNRLNYIDSWLQTGAYSKSGGQDNSFWGRSAANYLTVVDGVDTSDKWIENEAYADNYSKYWVDDIEGGKKVNEFDAEYWMTLTPARKSYLSLIVDDTISTGKYIDTPARIYIRKTEDGVRTSKDYKEQLIYIYGTKVMKSFGNLYNLYFTELHTVDANNLTDLILGWDGLDEKGNSWYNHGTNAYELSSMPLLTTANFSNIQYKNSAGSLVLDFSNSEKLQNFRATGSNFTQIKFAPGVALNTLYLPDSITTLELTEARQLTNIVTNYQHPTLNEATGEYIVQRGLYLENFTDKLDDIDKAKTDINYLSMINVFNMNYDSYKILNGLYRINKENSSNKLKITMTDIQWTPYRLVDDGSNYNPNISYYLDDGHLGLKPYNYSIAADVSGKEWKNHILNGELYYKDVRFDNEVTLIKDITMLEDFINKNQFISTTEGSVKPNLTGTIYVDNDSDITLNGAIINEKAAREWFSTYYPNITIFFKNIKKSYTARFVVKEDSDNPDEEKYTVVKTESIESSTGKFANPYTKNYASLIVKNYYDFKGWSSAPNGDIIKSEEWNGSITADQYTYTYYAIFELHTYLLKYCNTAYNDTHEDKSTSSLNVPYGALIADNTSQDYKSQDAKGRYIWFWKKGLWGKIYENSSLLQDIDRMTQTYHLVGFSTKYKDGYYSIEALSKMTPNQLWDELNLNQNQDLTLYPYYIPVPIKENIYPQIWTVDGNGVQNGMNYNIYSYSDTFVIPVKDYNNNYIKSLSSNFAASSELKNVYLEDVEKSQLSSFGNNCFDYCESLEHIDIPPMVKIIQNNCFRCNYKLKLNATSLQNIEIINSLAFRECNSITDLILPKISIMSATAFQNCKGLKVIKLGQADEPLKLLDNIEKVGSIDTPVFNITDIKHDQNFDILENQKNIRVELLGSNIDLNLESCRNSIKELLKRLFQVVPDTIYCNNIQINRDEYV